MKVLVLCESDDKSANFNVSKKIIKELIRLGHTVYVAYYIVDGSNLGEEIEHTNIYNIQSDKKLEYYKERYNLGWHHFTDKQRIWYIISHPIFATKFLNNFIDEKKGFASDRDNIEKICNENNIDFVLGISFPYNICSIVANIQVNAVKACVQLDPYSYNKMLPYSRINKRLKQDLYVIENVDYLFTTNLIIKDLIKNKDFKKNANKMVDIEFPLIEDYAVEQKEIVIENNPHNISFLYAGTFYNDIRNPKILVDLFMQLPQNCILYVAGTNSNEIRKYDEIIRNRVIDLGTLSIEQVRMAMMQVDFNICFNNSVNNQVPSKLFECINTGKPFINICQIEDCPTIDYVKNYDMAYIIFTDYMEKYIEAFMEFTKEKKGTICDRRRIMELFNKCTVEYVVNRMLNTI